MIPPNIIEQIRLRQSIFELISTDIELKSSGSRYSGLCPFHNEKTPSFYVNDEEGFYHCFGCGVHGDIFSYLMEQKSYTFLEAVKYLASKTGIQLPEISANTYKVDSGRKNRDIELRELMRIVLDVFQQELKNSNKALEYLKNRGVSDKSIKAFSLGVSPSTWSFLFPSIKKRLEKASIKKSDSEILDSLFKLGLVKFAKNQEQSKESASLKLENLKHYDSFRSRIIFPITKSDGQPIAFGGRLYLEEKQTSNLPKYINSSENPLYNKSQTFYGMAQSIKFIRKLKEVYLVEGYLDVIRMHEFGIENSLAACGTALNDSHSAVLKRLAKKVILLFDGDSAGLKAAASSIRSFLGSGFETEVCILESGEDPDSFLMKLSKQISSESDSSPDSSLAKEKFEVFRKSNSLPLLDFFIGYSLFAEKLEFKEGRILGVEKASAAKRGALSTEISSLLTKTTNPVERDILIDKAASILNVSKSSLNDLVSSSLQKESYKKSFKKKSYFENPISIAPLSREKPVVTIWEKQVISAIILSPELLGGFLEVYDRVFASYNIEGSINELNSSSELIRLGRFFKCLESNINSGTDSSHLTEATIFDSAIKAGYQQELVRYFKAYTSLEKMNPQAILDQASDVFSRLALKVKALSLEKVHTKGDEGSGLLLLQKKLALKQKHLRGDN